MWFKQAICLTDARKSRFKEVLYLICVSAKSGYHALLPGIPNVACDIHATQPDNPVFLIRLPSSIPRA